jgi:hypothetical protein
MHRKEINMCVLTSSVTLQQTFLAEYTVFSATDKLQAAQLFKLHSY